MTVGLIEMKKIQVAVILTAVSVTLALENIAVAGAVECEADHQCEGGYCYLETGKCVPCVDCVWYMRQSSPWRTCARKPEDCGECLSGFEYEYLTDGTTRSFCVLKRDIEGSGILNERRPYLWIIIISSSVIVILLITLIFKFYKVVKTRTAERNSNPDPEDPPPLNTDNENDSPPPSYDSSIPLLHQHSGVSSALVTSLTVIEKGGNTLQQAVPFSNPDPPYGIGGPVELENQFLDPIQDDVNGPVVDSGDESEGPRAISPPQLEDEDTMPSNWTPNRESPVSEEQHFEEGSSVSSSLSDINNLDVAGGASNAQEVLNDSGVSASCSHQSDLSCAHGVEGLEVASEQETVADNTRTVLQRHRSDEDLSTLAEIRERKRQRRDSGSSSMKSVETYREKV